MRSLRRGTALFILFIVTSTIAYSQHSVQVDDGGGRIALITAPATGVTGVLSYALPAGGGTLIVTGSGPSSAWLLGGNTLSALGSLPTQWLGTSTNDDVVMKANNTEKLRLVSGGGVKASMASGSSSTELVMSNSGVLETRTAASLSGIVPVVTNASLTGDGTTGTPLAINPANMNTWTGAQSFGAYSFVPSDPAALAAGTTHDWPAPGTVNSYYRITASGAATLTGITGGTAGRMIILSNIGTNSITLKHQTGSTGINQFDLPGGSDIILGARGAITLIYDGALGLWEVASTN